MFLNKGVERTVNSAYKNVKLRMNVVAVRQLISRSLRGLGMVLVGQSLTRKIYGKWLNIFNDSQKLYFR